MPLSGGTSGAHDDSMHQGNAKRDIVGGLASLGSAGDIAALGSKLLLVRNVSDECTINERATSESMFRMLRIGVNNYTLSVNESGVWITVITASDKDVVNGIAALDAAGSLLLPGSKMYYTRDGSDDVHIYERTSDEEAYAFHRVGADDYTFFVKESNVWKRMQTESMKDVANGIAGLDANARLVSDRIGVGSQRADHRSKIASANLRNSHDAEVDLTNTVIAKAKTITLTNGISGVLRFKMTLYNEFDEMSTLGKWYKNGVPLGVMHTESGIDHSTEFSEDLDVGVMQAGETLEVWAYGESGTSLAHTLWNARLYYDNAPFHVVAAVNS